MFFILYYGNFDPESNLLFLDNSYFAYKGYNI